MIYIYIYNLFSGRNINKKQSKLEDSGGGVGSKWRSFTQKKHKHKCHVHQGMLRGSWLWLAP